MIARQPSGKSTTMIDQVAAAIADADTGNAHVDPAQYQRLALAALKPLATPTETMIDAAHEAVWSDGFWAINSRRDFRKAIKAMILAAMTQD